MLRSTVSPSSEPTRVRFESPPSRFGVACDHTQPKSSAIAGGIGAKLTLAFPLALELVQNSVTFRGAL